MKVTVDEDTCTGCGACVSICPDVFDMEGDVAVVKDPAAVAGDEAGCRDAAESCPVEAIAIEE